MLSSPMLIGLTGGLATGKSTVARLFQNCGAYIIDADALAREVVQPGKPAWRDIVHRYGSGILYSDRTLNRPALAQIVFKNPRRLLQLNEIIHPRVAREQARLFREIIRKDPEAIVVYDVPLLFEAGVDKRVDKIVVVVADQKTQVTRLQKRNQLTKSEALRRLRAQMPLRRKMRRADYVLDGTLPPLQLRQAVKVLYKEWQQRNNNLGRRALTRKRKSPTFPQEASR